MIIMKKIIKGNYHAHTTWSDGEFSPKDIVKGAIKAGLDEICITDHYFTGKVSPNIDNDKIDAYIQEIKGLSEKYQGEIRILVGLEIDTNPNEDRNPRMKNLPFNELNKLDYVLFEYVEDRGWGGGCSLQRIIELRKNLTCEVGLAHPNIKKNFSHYKPDELARMLKENNIFLDACATERNSTPAEYEDKHFKPFFCGLGDEFKAAFRRYRVEFAPSTDTHDNPDLRTDLAYEKIWEYGFSLKHFKKKYASG
jgi:histidinol phosphatase-like PHP family hydrolase